ncbi:hypothetical protein COT72_00690 [archaeon CG10_big_fil_rev_8_21_14_0_10_43_11]|nr:MAG: hypothetical protein COT72_00690 [archaeon CG10_big_fil_rev_8_21_14_0_10_43_11]
MRVVHNVYKPVFDALLSMTRVLMTGSKEFPLGTNNNYDPSPSGGMEVYAQELAKRLSKHHAVTIITRKFPNTPAQENALGVDVVRVPFLRGRLIRNASYNLFAFVKTLFTPFDVLITHDLIASFLGAFSARLRRKPHIAVCHGIVSNQPQFSKLFRHFLRVVEHLAYNWPSLTVTHCPPRQIEQVTKNYVQVKPGFNFAYLRIPKKAHKRAVIVFTGRLLKVKRVDTLIEALMYLSFPYACFIVGDGEERKRLEALAKEKGVNTVFAGHVDDVAHYLLGADVFVLPSESESLGYSMLEAMSMNLPCVVTDLGIVSRKEAYVVPVAQPRALARALTTAFRNKELSRKKVKAAHAFLKSFSWNNATKHYLEAINKLTR